MKFLKPRILIPLLAVFLTASAGAVMVIASPGDSNDPLITLSYINDTLIPQLKEYVDSKTASGSTPSQSGSTVTGSSGYTLVSVKAKHKIIGAEGTEFVLRMGSGTIVATSNGGVADLTDGVDLTDGMPVPANHSLLSPKDDKRGFHMDTDGLVLIKGTYTVIPD